jgi:hypothetical protein
MPAFDDYHRTVVGYHGTTLSVALRLVTRVSRFVLSERDFDWLGRGVYFWEYSPKQALNFARIRQGQLRKRKNKSVTESRRADEPLAVVACTIRLGICLDLTEPENVEYLGEVFESYRSVKALAGTELPKNTRKYRKLDRDVFEYAYKQIEDTEPNQKVDTARGIYVPTGGDKRVWEGSWISRDTHIQLCVRNPANLLGTWLHHPASMEIDDVRKSLQEAGPDVIQPEGPQGENVAEGDVEGKTD